MSTSYLPAATNGSDSEPKTSSESISILYRILENLSSSPGTLRLKETVITMITYRLRRDNRAEEIGNLLTQLRPLLSSIPKSRTAKIVRGILDDVAKIPGSSHLHISLCKELVQWTRAEKHVFLRQRIEARLAALLMENKDYSDALNVITGLTEEVKRLDDKRFLVDMKLMESKIHCSLKNLPKANVALTVARTVANAIHIPRAQEAAIDLQRGILILEEEDYFTAFGFLLEAYQTFDDLEDPRALFSLKYVMLCYILNNQSHYAIDMRTSTTGMKYSGVELDAMQAVANADCERSLKLLEAAVRDYRAQLEEDPIVHRHLSFLYENLMERILCYMIVPYSRVEIGHFAERMELPIDVVEKKLSQMILDKKFAGTVDEGDECLIIFDEPETDGVYEAAVETISNIGKVVDSLFVRAAKIII